MDFCFASDMGFISYPGFFHPVLVSAEASLRLFRVFKHFPILRKIIPWAPNWLITRNVKGFLMLRKFLTNQIDMFIDHPKSLEDVSHPVVLQRLLDPNVKGARGPLTRSALLCESQGLFLAGGNAVGNVVSVGTYHILNHPEVYQRLLEELRENWPLLEEMPKYEKLEKLPYFVSWLSSRYSF